MMVCSMINNAHALSMFVLMMTMICPLQEKKDSGVLHAGSERNVFKDISAEADSLELKESKAVMALVELLFDAQAVQQVERILYVH